MRTKYRNKVKNEQFQTFGWKINGEQYKNFSVTKFRIQKRSVHAEIAFRFLFIRASLRCCKLWKWGIIDYLQLLGGVSCQMTTARKINWTMFQTELRPNLVWMIPLNLWMFSNLKLNTGHQIIVRAEFVKSIKLVS